MKYIKIFCTVSKTYKISQEKIITQNTLNNILKNFKNCQIGALVEGSIYGEINNIGLMKMDNSDEKLKKRVEILSEVIMLLSFIVFSSIFLTTDNGLNIYTSIIGGSIFILMAIKSHNNLYIKRSKIRKVD